MYVILGVAILYLLYGMVEFLFVTERYQPSKGDTISVVASNVTITAAYEVTSEGKTFTLLFGEITKAYASGPPVYVVNEEGILVDWTSDSGESPSFNAQWLSLPRKQVELESLGLKAQLTR